MLIFIKMMMMHICIIIFVMNINDDIRGVIFVFCAGVWAKKGVFLCVVCVSSV